MCIFAQRRTYVTPISRHGLVAGMHSAYELYTCAAARQFSLARAAHSTYVRDPVVYYTSSCCIACGSGSETIFAIAGGESSGGCGCGNDGCGDCGGGSAGSVGEPGLVLEVAAPLREWIILSSSPPNDAS